jgi:hypothetical protein
LILERHNYYLCKFNSIHMDTKHTANSFKVAKVANNEFDNPFLTSKCKCEVLGHWGACQREVPVLK